VETGGWQKCNKGERNNITNNRKNRQNKYMEVLGHFRAAEKLPEKGKNKSSRRIEKEEERGRKKINGDRVSS